MRLRSNVALLTAGFAMGQGSLFLAHTRLVAGGEVGFVGLYGLGFTFLMLAHALVDWGGITVLARVAASEPTSIGSRYWSLVVVRLLALMVLVPLLFGASWLEGSGFYRHYLAAALPGLAVTVLNMGGILDGRRLSGPNGFAAGLPHLFTAISLLLVSVEDSLVAGLVLGSAFSAGIVLHVFAQLIVLNRSQQEIIRAPNPTWTGVRQMAIEGAMFLASWVPSQLLYRIQVILATTILGPAGAGVLVYAKQVVNAALQATHFVRRAEFPRLVEFTRAERSLALILREQRASNAIAATASLMLAVAGISGVLLAPASFHGPAQLLVAFALLPFAANLGGNMKQLAYAIGAPHLAAGVSLASLALLPFVYRGALHLGALWWLAIVEVVANIAIALVLSVLLSRHLRHAN